VPVDAQFSSLGEMPYELVHVETLIGELRRAKGLRIAILDACRDNAAERELKRVTSRGGEITRGLARVKNPEGLILAYATQYLSTAADGDPNGDSPFTAALLNHIVTPGLDVKDLFYKVGREVIETTKGGQRPEISISFYDAYALVPAEPVTPIPAPITSTSHDQAERAWAAVKDTTSISVLEAFVKRFGDSFYGDMARMRIDDLKKTPPVAAVSPPEQRPIPVQQQPQVAAVVPPIVPASPCGGVIVASLSSRSAQPLSTAEECGLKPRDVFKECDKCPEMAVVPSGSFMMGSPAGEEGRSSDESPQHSVTISKPFAVGRLAVTFDEWDACVADGGCNGYKPADGGWGRGRQPVINVSWTDAEAYVTWLSRKTGKVYRLLTEAEREYVTRAGTTTPFWWGASISTSQANYDGSKTYGGGSKGESRQKTVPVDSFPPNPWGLYQVHGNVWDWVEDCYHNGYTGAPSDGSARISETCSRVFRGGSWHGDPMYLRSAHRGVEPPDSRNDYRGFRLARTLTP
jgi:formylglycine-generating enzyme required for sulfatase activity